MGPGASDARPHPAVPTRVPHPRTADDPGNGSSYSKQAGAPPMTQSGEQTSIWLTKKTFDRLQAELDHLQGPARAEIIARISAARDEGDLKENGGYHAAKDEQ